MPRHGFSPRATALLAGLLYLLDAACGLWAEAFVRGKLIVSGDPAATAARILAHTTLYRSGFTADIASQVLEVGIALLFYRLFAPVGRGLAAAMVLFRLAWVAIFTTITLTQIAPLLLLEGGAQGLAAGQAQALSYLLLRLHGQGYAVALVFFGMSCLLLGLLIWRCRFLPRLLGALMALAGLCYLGNSFSDFLLPALARSLGMWPLLPCALAEYALILWLLAFGIKPATGGKRPGQIAPFPDEV